MRSSSSSAVVDDDLGGGPLPVPARVQLLSRDAVLADVPLIAASSDAAGFRVTATIAASAEFAGRFDVELDIERTAVEAVEVAVAVVVRLGSTTDPGWLIPGLFYGQNRVPECRVRYPRFAADPTEGDVFTSDRWWFRADRAATPAVFAWGAERGAAIAAHEVSPLGETGVGFALDADAADIRLCFPYREEPVVYDGSGAAAPPDIRLHAWSAGDRHRLAFRVYVLPRDRHAYAPVLRDVAEWLRPPTRVAGWMGVEAAASLAAIGLRDWHLRERSGLTVVYETAVFERPHGPVTDLRDDRPAMHVGWVSGIPTAWGLLLHGRRTGDAALADAAIRVIDGIAANLAPCGTFWDQWTLSGGWTGGWTPGPGGLHARTLGEAALFLGRALAAEGAQAIDRGSWRTALQSNLNFVVANQRDDGRFPAAWTARGRITQWSGAAGLTWVPALVDGSRSFARPDWLAAARKAGDYYARFIDDEFIYGAPEDVDLAPTSEDGYVALMAYVALADASEGDEADRWTDLARRSADWLLTFRYSYDVDFDPRTLLGTYGFRTLGADQASVANQHLHDYGLVCLPEMVRLAGRIGDNWYLDRTRENLACFRQFIARFDGDFNARRGMATERYYQTMCFGPKGGILTLSHSWCLGLLLFACETVLADARLLEALS